MTLISSNQNSKTVFEFNSACPIELWQVVDDVVMGGKSSGNFTLTEEGNGLFNGGVSIENNGGFSSVRLNLDSFKIGKEKAIVLDVKGDGSEFQLRIKASIYDRHSFVYNFKTSDGGIHLHAKAIQFTHPVSKTPIYINAVPPDDVLWNECTKMI